MSNRYVDVMRIPTSEPAKFLEVSVRYDDAKSEFMGFGERQRGFYVVVSLIEDHNDGWTKLLVGRGGKGFLEPAARFNRRRLDQLVEAARNPENGALKAIVDRVLEKNGLARQPELEPQAA